MKSLLLISALMFAPMMETTEIVEEPTIVEPSISEEPTEQPSISEEPTIEEPTETPVVFEKSTYTFEDETTKGVITLVSETECVVKTMIKETQVVEEYKGTYTLENDVLTIVNGENTKLYTIGVDCFLKDKETQTEEDKLAEEFKKFVDKYLNANFIADIINWAITSGLLTVIATIIIKTRKYKAKTSKELEKAINDTIDKVLGDLNDKQQKEIKKALELNNEAVKMMVQALVLSQDKTAEGKKALLDLAMEINKNPELATETTTKAVEIQKKEIDKEVELSKKVKNKVEKEYTPID